RHASGSLAAGERQPAWESTVWPPPDAVAIDLAEAYERLAEQGYDYGPVFRGLQAAWTVREEIVAEVAVPEDSDAGEYGIHPALLDAALHAIGLAGSTAGGLMVPFAWTGVELHATGASCLRVRLSPVGENAVSLVATDPEGRPVVSVSSLAFRPVAGG